MTHLSFGLPARAYWMVFGAASTASPHNEVTYLLPLSVHLCFAIIFILLGYDFY